MPKGPTKEELKQKKKQEENERVKMLQKKLYFKIWLKNVSEIKKEKERIRKVLQIFFLFVLKEKFKGRRREKIGIGEIYVCYWNRCKAAQFEPKYER